MQTHHPSLKRLVRLPRFAVGLLVTLSGGAVVIDGGVRRTGLLPNANFAVITYGLALIAFGIVLALYPFEKFRNRSFF